mgnify:CR=1 FL=1
MIDKEQGSSQEKKEERGLGFVDSSGVLHFTAGITMGGSPSPSFTFGDTMFSITPVTPSLSPMPQGDATLSMLSFSVVDG